MWVLRCKKTGKVERMAWNYTLHKETGNGSLTDNLDEAKIYANKRVLSASWIYQELKKGNKETKENWEFVKVQIALSGDVYNG